MNFQPNGPKLVDKINFKPIQMESFSLNSIKKKWGINKIILTGFIIFTIFFLYNCKYGIFKYPNLELAAY